MNTTKSKKSNSYISNSLSIKKLKKKNISKISSKKTKKTTCFNKKHNLKEIIENPWKVSTLDLFSKIPKILLNHLCGNDKDKVRLWMNNEETVYDRSLPEKKMQNLKNNENFFIFIEIVIRITCNSLKLKSDIYGLLLDMIDENYDIYKTDDILKQKIYDNIKNNKLFQRYFDYSLFDELMSALFEWKSLFNKEFI